MLVFFSFEKQSPGREFEGLLWGPRRDGGGGGGGRRAPGRVVKWLLAGTRIRGGGGLRTIPPPKIRGGCIVSVWVGKPQRS